jgi:hypothetical protein
MIRSMLAAGLALVALYVLVQPGASGKVESGSNVLVGGLRRLLSGDVPGLPDYQHNKVLGKKIEPNRFVAPPGMQTG